MASIRRTLSPYQRSSSYQNGNPFSTQSHNNNNNNNNRFLLSGLFHHQKHNNRKLNHFSWKKPLLRCSIFFFLGFLLGMAPDLNRDVTGTLDFDNSHLPDSTLVHSFKENNNYNNNNSNNSSNSDGVGDDVNIAVNAVEFGLVSTGSVVVPRKQLIVVTPTYNRALQAYYLNRLGHVLRLVRPPLLWIVVEMGAASMETAEVLRSLGVMYRHLVCLRNLTDVKDRGVHQRNTAIEHIVKHRLDGVVYFADDDNVYSLELFENLREISRFGTWPVGMLAQSKNKAILEGPVCNGSQVIGWHTNEKSKRLRRFHVDMSGFAFNSTILWDPKRWHRPTSEPIRQLDTVKEGFQETTFIEQIVEDESQMEGIPTGCHRIMNWHLHLEARGLAYPKGWMLQKKLNAGIPVK